MIYRFINVICNKSIKIKTMATIKNIILLALISFMMIGCEYYENPSRDYSPRFKTVYIDSCEWLMYKYTSEIAHKGNCRFCKERRQKELEELVIKLKKN